MNKYNMYNFLDNLSFTRMGGTTEELKAANIIKEQIESFGGKAILFPFQITSFKVNNASLSSNNNNYYVSGVKGSGNIDETLPFYYMETILDTDMYDIEGKIVLINGIMNKKIYQKLLKYHAKAFISYSGDITNNDTNSDLENKELREVLRKKGVIPGVHLKVNDAINLVKENPKELHITLNQEELVLTSHNVISEIKGTTYPDEIITITAHYDSVEFSKGAYDNGAGSVLILKLYEYFMHNLPKRTLRFIWCGSEELGLLGSKAYVNSLIKEELDKIIFNINVDVAGTVLGSEYAVVTAEEALSHYIEYLSKEIAYPILINQDIYSSDSIPFADKSIPAVNLMRFASRGAGHIHDRHDTMSFISEASLNHTYLFLEYLAERLINAKVFAVKKVMPENLIKKIDEYLFKKED